VSIHSSICIVSYNRKAELKLTLEKILERIDTDTEVIVGLDGCSDGSIDLKSDFPNVIWMEFPNHVGASTARRAIYEKAKGDYIFGFDDDSHPVTEDFIEKAIQTFRENNSLGIVAFRIFNGIQLPESQLMDMGIGSSYACSEFAGCGYAITRKAYEATGGFPDWMNIYGEEAYVSLRAFECGYRLIYEPSILVHHRVDRQARKSEGYQKFRFGLQLRNNLVLFLNLYPFPMNIRSCIKCVLHNMYKYGFKSISWHMLFLRSLRNSFSTTLKITENKIPAAVLNEWMKLPLPVFDWCPNKSSHA
jgi:GT2 family glycosyltransferase